MTFIFVHMVIGAIIFAACLIIIHHAKVQKKYRMYIIAFFVSSILTTILSIVPFENAFFTFHSAEEAFAYRNNAKISLVVEGKNSALVVGQQKNRIIESIIPRENDGWKISTPLKEQTLLQIFDESYIIYTYCISGNSDIYVRITNTTGIPIEVSDNNNSVYICLDSDEMLDNHFSTYYAFINCSRESVEIYINGKVYPISTMQSIGDSLREAG